MRAGIKEVAMSEEEVMDSRDITEVDLTERGL